MNDDSIHGGGRRLVVAVLLLLPCLSFSCDSAGPETYVLASPDLESPANGKADAPDALELVWRPVIGSRSYDVQLSTRADMSAPIIDRTGVLQTWLVIHGLVRGTTCYWRVRSSGESGAGDWSEVWSFTPDREAAAPNSPTLLSPAPGADYQRRTLTVRWHAAEDASSYDVQVSLEPSFLRIRADLSDVHDTEALIHGLVNLYTYYWRVRSVNPVGTSAWSETWEFVVDEG